MYLGDEPNFILIIKKGAQVKSILKYLIILPILLISFSCDETVADSTIHNGDIVGSWMLTGLTGTYNYVIDFPEENTGHTYTSADTFGIRIRWDYADATGVGDAAEFWVPGAKFGVQQTALYTEKEYDLPTMEYAGFGLIGVFQDAPSAGDDATYLMRGRYPGIFYNWSECASSGSTAPMTDQGLYTWDQTSYNFTIKRDLSIAGSQVLPPFNDGTLTMTDDTTMNIVFKDRDSHSTLYSEIMDSWDEGNHPDTLKGGNGENSGGDRTYMAFPPLILDSDGAFAGTWDAALHPESAQASSGFFRDSTNVDLASWSYYLTWYAFSFGAEVDHITGLIMDGTLDPSSVELDGVAGLTGTDFAMYMGGAAQLDPTKTTVTGLLYAELFDPSTGGLENDSGHAFSPTDAASGGKMNFNVDRDCAVPVDVTIDFDATFTKCTTDNCTGDGYHVTPAWD
jgi:hypothetical protein